MPDDDRCDVRRLGTRPYQLHKTRHLSPQMALSAWIIGSTLGWAAIYLLISFLVREAGFVL